VNIDSYRLPEGWTLLPFDTASTGERFMFSAAGRRWQVNAATAALLETLAANPVLARAADELARRWDREVEPAALAAYLERELVPAGMVLSPGAAAAAPRKGRGSLEFLTFRRTLVPARLLFRASSVLSALFSPRLFWLVFVAAVAVAAWVLAHAAARGTALVAAMATPTAVLWMLASALAHELGHAAACRRFGTSHGDLGFGLYVVFPVLYMEVDETWKLSRGQRAVVDAGGLYFQVLFGLALLAAAQAVPSLATPALGCLGLIGVALFTNLNPFFRFDGYWLASDLLGVPNLRQRSQRVMTRGWRRLRGVLPAGERVLPDDFAPRTAALLAAYAVLSSGFFAYYFVRLLVAIGRFATGQYPRLAEDALRSAAGALEAGAPGRALAAVLSLLVATLLVAFLPLLLLFRVRGILMFWKRGARAAANGASAG